MAVKTITIDLEAYEALRRHKSEGQSFSRVIKEHFGGRKTGKTLIEALAKATLSEETLDALDDLVEARQGDQARSVNL
jgi:predicted CopG family antitoxin